MSFNPNLPYNPQTNNGLPDAAPPLVQQPPQVINNNGYAQNQYSRPGAKYWENPEVAFANNPQGLAILRQESQNAQLIALQANSLIHNPYNPQSTGGHGLTPAHTMANYNARYGGEAPMPANMQAKVTGGYSPGTTSQGFVQGPDGSWNNPNGTPFVPNNLNYLHPGEMIAGQEIRKPFTSVQAPQQISYPSVPGFAGLQGQYPREGNYYPIANGVLDFGASRSTGTFWGSNTGALQFITNRGQIQASGSPGFINPVTPSMSIAPQPTLSRPFTSGNYSAPISQVEYPNAAIPVTQMKYQAPDVLGAISGGVNAIGSGLNSLIGGETAYGGRNQEILMVSRPFTSPGYSAPITVPTPTQPGPVYTPATGNPAFPKTDIVSQIMGGISGVGNNLSGLLPGQTVNGVTVAKPFVAPMERYFPTSPTSGLMILSPNELNIANLAKQPIEYTQSINLFGGGNNTPLVAGTATGVQPLVPSSLDINNIHVHPPSPYFPNGMPFSDNDFRSYAGMNAKENTVFSQTANNDTVGYVFQRPPAFDLMEGTKGVVNSAGALLRSGPVNSAIASAQPGYVISGTNNQVNTYESRAADIATGLNTKLFKLTNITPGESPSDYGIANYNQLNAKGSPAPQTFTPTTQIGTPYSSVQNLSVVQPTVAAPSGDFFSQLGAGITGTANAIGSGIMGVNQAVVNTLPGFARGGTIITETGPQLVGANITALGNGAWGLTQSFQNTITKTITPDPMPVSLGSGNVGMVQGVPKFGAVSLVNATSTVNPATNTGNSLGFNVYGGTTEQSPAAPVIIGPFGFIPGEKNSIFGTIAQGISPGLGAMNIAATASGNQQAINAAQISSNLAGTAVNTAIGSVPEGYGSSLYGGFAGLASTIQGKTPTEQTMNQGLQMRTDFRQGASDFMGAVTPSVVNAIPGFGAVTQLAPKQFSQPVYNTATEFTQAAADKFVRNPANIPLAIGQGIVAGPIFTEGSAFVGGLAASKSLPIVSRIPVAGDFLANVGRFGDYAGQYGMSGALKLPVTSGVKTGYVASQLALPGLMTAGMGYEIASSPTPTKTAGELGGTVLLMGVGALGTRGLTFSQMGEIPGNIARTPKATLDYMEVSAGKVSPYLTQRELGYNTAMEIRASPELITFEKPTRPNKFEDNYPDANKIVDVMGLPQKGTAGEIKSGFVDSLVNQKNIPDVLRPNVYADYGPNVIELSTPPQTGLKNVFSDRVNTGMEIVPVNYEFGTMRSISNTKGTAASGGFEISPFSEFDPTFGTTRVTGIAFTPKGEGAMGMIGTPGKSIAGDTILNLAKISRNEPIQGGMQPFAITFKGEMVTTPMGKIGGDIPNLGIGKQRVPDFAGTEGGYASIGTDMYMQNGRMIAGSSRGIPEVTEPYNINILKTENPLTMQELMVPDVNPKNLAVDNPNRVVVGTRALVDVIPKGMSGSYAWDEATGSFIQVATKPRGKTVDRDMVSSLSDAMADISNLNKGKPGRGAELPSRYGGQQVVTSESVSTAQNSITMPAIKSKTSFEMELGLQRGFSEPSTAAISKETGGFIIETNPVDMTSMTRGSSAAFAGLNIPRIANMQTPQFVPDEDGYSVSGPLALKQFNINAQDFSNINDNIKDNKNYFALDLSGMGVGKNVQTFKSDLANYNINDAISINQPVITSRMDQINTQVTDITQIYQNDQVFQNFNVNQFDQLLVNPPSVTNINIGDQLYQNIQKQSPFTTGISIVNIGIDYPERGYMPPAQPSNKSAYPKEFGMIPNLGGGGGGGAGGWIGSHNFGEYSPLGSYSSNIFGILPKGFF